MPVGLLAALMAVAPAFAGGSSSSSAFAEATRTSSPRLATGTLVVTPHEAAGPVGVDSHHLVWESGPIESDQFAPLLHDRDLASGKTRTLSNNVDSLFGLASTSRFVFYAQPSGGLPDVVRVSHRGTGARVLTRALVTPIASRGDVVAWGEQSGPFQRVVAYGGAESRRWIVARMKRCTIAGCYRLGTVTVAKDGIVFTRDAVGAQPALVVRRAFGAKKIESRAIPQAPQPNLVPSSSGALYYVLSHGWYRWDFGKTRPRPVAFANGPDKSLILHEGSRWYWLTRRGCGVRIESTRGGNAGALAVPRRMLHLGADYGPTCTQLGALAWAGKHAVASWAIAAEAAEDAHNDVGLHGVVVSASVAGK